MTDNTELSDQPEKSRNYIEEELKRRKAGTLPTPLNVDPSDITESALQMGFEINLKEQKKKADPWTRVNIKVPTLAKYEVFAKKNGKTGQQLITLVLDTWIEEKTTPKKK
jgi:hypothetical protein